MTTPIRSDRSHVAARQTAACAAVRRARARAGRTVLQMTAVVQAAIVATLAWSTVRMAEAKTDERGLTTSEYVALGSIVVVAAGVVGTLIASFLSAKAGQIVNTP